MLEEREHPLGPAVAVLGERLQLDAARLHERGLGQREDTRRREQDDDRNDLSDACAHDSSFLTGLAPGLELGEAREDLAFAPLHRLGLVRLRVVVVEEMEEPVHDEQRELGVERDRALGGLTAATDGHT